MVWYVVLVCLTRSGPIPKLNLSVLGIISNTVPDSDNKVFIGGLPYNLTEDQVRNPRPVHEHGTRNMEHRTRNAKHRTRNTEHKIRKMNMSTIVNMNPFSVGT